LDKNGNIIGSSKLKNKENEKLFEILHEQLEQETHIFNSKSKKNKFVKERVKIKDTTKLLDQSFDFDDGQSIKDSQIIKKSKVLYDGVECNISFYIFNKNWRI